MPYLQELPNHRGLEERAYATGGNNQCVESEHELVQPGKEGPVLECLGHKRIDFLFERELNPADLARSGAPAAPSLAACISPGPPPVIMSQPISASAAAARLVLSAAGRSRLYPGRIEDSHTVALLCGWL